jgi:hypothetical protein
MSLGSLGTGKIPVICYSLLLKIAIGIVDLAIKNADLPGPPLGGSSHLVSGL